MTKKEIITIATGLLTNTVYMKNISKKHENDMSFISKEIVNDSMIILKEIDNRF